MKKLVALEIMFENCESIIIPIHYVDIRFELSHECQYLTYLKQKDYTLYLKNVKLIIDNQFENCQLFQNNLYEDYSAYKRLINSRDITHVVYIFNDYSTEQYAIPYNGELNLSVNKYQKNIYMNNYLEIDIKEED